MGALGAGTRERCLRIQALALGSRLQALGFRCQGRGQKGGWCGDWRKRDRGGRDRRRGDWGGWDRESCDWGGWDGGSWDGGAVRGRRGSDFCGGGGWGSGLRYMRGNRL